MNVITAVLAAASFLLIAWAFLLWRLQPAARLDLTDPYGADVAQFRRQMHDWDREG